MMLTWLPLLPMPIKKLSGLMSRWMKLRECTYSIREIWGRCVHHQFYEGLGRIRKGTDELISQQKGGLKRELAGAKVEQVF